MATHHVIIGGGPAASNALETLRELDPSARISLICDEPAHSRMALPYWLADQIPRQLSFKHTVQIWIAWQQRGGDTHNAVCIHGLLVRIAEPRVGLRPGRVEPRALKRRPKPFPLLTKPRPDAKEEIRKHGHPKKQR